MVHRVVLPSGDLAVKLQTLRSSPDPLFIYFTADKSGKDGERWCPDCRSADPVIEEALLSAPASATLLEVRVSRPEWKESPGPAHFLRRDPFRVTSVPTVAQFDAAQGKIIRRFVDGECEQLESLVDMFMGAHFEGEGRM